MNKKAKITLNLSAITIALAVGAQVYTNHKIDQILQQFPYHFSNQFKIYVEQTQRSFFNRDLVFKLESEGNKTEIINTNLTALPFAITAKSEIPLPLIRQLNARFNIAIDSNTITSKFSVVGDYLQSNMVTQFRDPTNTPQLLETDLNYSYKTQQLDLQTELNGFQYDSVTNIKDLVGKFVLQPFADQRYDLVKADVKFGTINFIDGENNHFSAEKTNYMLNKSFGDVGYDLKIDLNSEKFNFKNAKHSVQLNNVKLNSNKFGTPNEITFYEEWNKFNKNQLTFPQLVETGLKHLFDNHKFETQLSVQKTVLDSAQNQVNLDKFDWVFNADNQDKQNVVLTNQIKLEQATQLNKENKENQQVIFNLQGLVGEQSINQLNLAEYLQIIKTYLPDLNKEITPFSKTTDNFLDDLIKLSQKNQYKLAYKLDVKSLTIPELFQSETIHLEQQDDLSLANQVSRNLQMTVDNIQLPMGNMKLSQVKLAFPLIIRSELIKPILACGGELSLICMAHISLEKSEESLKELAKDLEIDINNANFSANVDTLTKSSTAGEINATLTLNVPRLDKLETKMDPVAQKIQVSTGNVTLAIPAPLVDDMQGNHKLNELKSNSPLWQQLKNIIYVEDKLTPYFQLEDGKYVLNFEYKNSQALLNGKDIKELFPAPTPSDKPLVEPQIEEKAVEEIPTTEQSPINPAKLPVQENDKIEPSVQ